MVANIITSFPRSSRFETDGFQTVKPTEDKARETNKLRRIWSRLQSASF